MKSFQIKALVIILLTFLFPLYLQAKPLPNRFIVISDIHFNPFAACKTNQPQCPIVNQLVRHPVTQWEKIFNQYGQKTVNQYLEDTNDALLKSTLNYMKSKPVKLKFVIVLGDFLAHHFIKKYQFYTGDSSLKNYQFFVSKTLAFISSELKKSFPNTPIYPVIGNNDSYNGDDFNNNNGMFYHALTNIWSAFFINSNNKKAFLKTFAHGGYYSVTPISEPHHRLIVLNSVLFYAKAKGVNIDNAANKEMGWLATQLKNAATSGEKVLMVMHIPYGINVYGTVINEDKSPVLFWKKEYNERFLALLKQYSFTISGVLTGHIHMDGFQLFSTDVNHNNIIIDTSTPAISPAFGNNPGFKIYSYDPESFTLKNFATYYLNVANASPLWKIEYNFNRTYQPSCRDCKLINGVLAIHQTGKFAEDYEHFYGVDTNSQPITKGDWLPYYWCGIYYQTVEAYRQCIAKQRRAAPS